MSEEKDSYAELLKCLDSIVKKDERVGCNEDMLNKILVKTDGLRGAIEHLTLKIDSINGKMDASHGLLCRFSTAFCRIFG